MLLSWLVEEIDAGHKLGDYLRSEKGFSRRLLKVMKNVPGHLLVNKEPEPVHFVLSAGDVIDCIFPEEEKGEHLTAETMPLQILFEDESVLIVVKPAGIASIPSRDHLNGTLANGVLAHFNKLRLTSTVHIVTRLDRDTSGLVLIAKHRYAHALLAASQKEGAIQRTYTAIVQGSVTDEKGTINLPIGRKEGSIIERKVSNDGKPAITHYEKISDLKGHTLLSINLETGRTHQIRVHFSHIGHPLAGDVLYGGSDELLDNQALHCSKLSFHHPITKEKLTFQVEMPADMQRFIHQNS
ncbi:MAG: RluA family pseudouridine synthase [Enterococcus sp.]|nr:RluA family pseudouridine synthase [Enterococcus sp.]